ncbi:probable tRNA methyltransferase 9B isoform X2 [Oncorhynchus masou masou]|uniref:probable tRNA methyltransferase 9B isoform X2 n=1 Tax=Oncorhynchus masou masou TaxID=90313 RepID=UPI0031844735
MTVMEEAATRLEREHVHSVYEKIAPYFNDSRYKAWPKVRQFLLDHEPGSIIADVVIHHLSTKERRIRAIKEMARTLRVGGRIMIYVWAMEQTRRKFQKQDIFVPWNPNPPSPTLGRERPTPRRRGAVQSMSECLYSDKNRKVKSTSSMLDKEEMTCCPHQSHRLWFFSRSLDSVFDFGSLTISRSTSRELISTVSSRLGEAEGGKVGRRGAGLIKQLSSLFSGFSRNNSEEDVFDSVTDLARSQRDHGNDNHSNSTEKTSVPTALVQECGSVALPDLVSSYQREHTEGPGEREAGPPGDLKQDSEGEPEAASCLRYYHVFREGELAELIESHVQELHVLYSCFDHANWCVVAEKVQVWNI